MPRYSNLYRLDESQFTSVIKARGVTLDALAMAAGVTRSSLWRWRNGQPASGHNASGVAGALGLALGDLWINWGAE